MRAGTDESESLTVRNQEMEGIDRSTSTGVGIRVLVGGRWGFAATARLDDAEIARTARLAVEMAKAAQRLPGDPVSLTPVDPATASWRTPVQEDPFTVPLEEKVALLMEARGVMQGCRGPLVRGGRARLLPPLDLVRLERRGRDRAGDHELGRRHRGHRGRRR